jgi:hypothetical protein
MRCNPYIYDMDAVYQWTLGFMVFVQYIWSFRFSADGWFGRSGSVHTYVSLFQLFSLTLALSGVCLLKAPH